MHTTIREATPADIPTLHSIRTAVRENKLFDPGLIGADDYREFLTERGKGWLCEVDGEVAGFAIADLQGHNIWALFVNPDAEGKGIGRQLHDAMLRWYFAQTKEPVWLSTAPGTRAETFYHKAGWKETGVYGKGEIRFEMCYEDWAT